MCFSSGSNAPAAAAALQQQQRIDQQVADRNSAVTEGKGKIDSAFAQFDDPYFAKYEDTFKGAYNPQLDDQYAKAKDKLTAGLAGRGMLESTPGAAKFAEAGKAYGDARANIASSATDSANGLRSSIDNTKTGLYDLNANAADPAAAGARATAAAGSIVAPSAYPQLSNVFSAALAPLAAANRTDQTSMNPRAPWNQFASGRGSALFG